MTKTHNDDHIWRWWLGIGFALSAGVLVFVIRYNLDWFRSVFFGWLIVAVVHVVAWIRSTRDAWWKHAGMILWSVGALWILGRSLT